MKNSTTINAQDPRARRFPDDLFKRWFLYGLAAFVGGELVFALISGLLDERGPVLDAVGHLPTLFALGAVITLAQRRALNMSPSWITAGVVGVLTAVSYIAGFALMGPPLDFLLSLVVIGVATGVGLWLALRGQVRGAAWCLAAVGIGYAVGAGAGVGAAIMFGDTVNGIFGGHVTGFMGVVGMIGIIAGTVGSLLSGAALSRILSPRATSEHGAVSTAS